jgi:hypothetical protein
MLQFAIKIVVSAFVVAAVSELGRRQVFLGALLASLPLTSVLALCWLYRDTGDPTRVAALASGIFWMVLPSLLLFLLLPALLARGWPFWPALGTACIATAAAYAGMTGLFTRLGGVG